MGYYAMLAGDAETCCLKSELWTSLGPSKIRTDSFAAARQVLHGSFFSINRQPRSLPLDISTINQGLPPSPRPWQFEVGREQETVRDVILVSELADAVGFSLGTPKAGYGLGDCAERLGKASVRRSARDDADTVQD